MATPPPPPNQRDPHNHPSQMRGRNRGFYIAAGFVVVVILVWLLSGFFRTAPVTTGTPQTTAPETGAPAGTDQGTAAPPPPADAATDTPGEDDGSLVIEGDAEVEVLDDT